MIDKPGINPQMLGKKNKTKKKVEAYDLTKVEAYDLTCHLSDGIDLKKKNLTELAFTYSIST